MKENSCCCQSSDCCSSESEKKKIVIDFLYLDLSVCERCQGAESNLDTALNEVSSVLKSAGFDILVNKVNINRRELAIKYEFLSSPTIRVNGKDIASELKESACTECGDLCGDDVDCRVWIYEGKEYTEPPKEFIINAILKEVYAGKKAETTKKEKYGIPENLEKFFEGLESK